MKPVLVKAGFGHRLATREELRAIAVSACQGPEEKCPRHGSYVKFCKKCGEEQKVGL